MIKRHLMLRGSAVIVGLATVITLGGCSSPGISSAANTMSNLVMFQSTTPPVPMEMPKAEDSITCPPVKIGGGAAIRSYGGQTGDSQTVRNQMAINDVARECTNTKADGSFTLKIGVQGRVVIGPAGSPGAYNANLRMVVTRSGKVVANRVVRIGATIAPGQGGAEFVHVEENILVPPGAKEPDIEVTLDQGGAAKASRRR